MIKIHHPRTLLLCSFCLLCLNGFSNNIQVSNVTLTSRNTSAGSNNAANFTQVQFNLSWENSWRVSVGPSNWDAAWVFVKFLVGASNPVLNNVNSSGTTVTVSTTANLRVGMPLRVTDGMGAFASNTVISSITNATQFVVSTTPSTALNNASIECIRIWEHAIISTSEANHIAPTGSTIAPASDGTGAFIYRSAEGTGTFSLNAVQLRWNYGTNGVRDDALVNVQVFGIEMVYVPQGSFNVGGGGGTSAFTSTTINTATATTAPGGTGSLGGQAGGYPTGQTAPASASWPNGFNAFYMMKYEISQGQYRDFLNTLTPNQQANRVTMDGTVGRYAGGFVWNGSSWSLSEVSNLTSPANRIGLRLIADPGGISPRTYACDLNTSTNLPTEVNQSDDGEWIAMGQLNWMDGCAYMDWAGLRPMTELEFEKACRGDQAAVSGEYAWGNATTTSANNITNGGQAGEITNTANANSASTDQANVQGPLRVGAFAGAATTRAQAGATYYGIMEMSGNVWERAVTIGNTAGRAYTGDHGDGILHMDGSANVDFWPGINGNSSNTTANTTFGGTTGVTHAAGSGFRGGAWRNDLSFMHVSDRSDATSAYTPRLSNNGFRGVRSAP